jgi:hypothetical protein
MKQSIRLCLLLSSIPFVAFTCFTVRQISVNLQSKVINSFSTKSGSMERYEAVLQILTRWAEEQKLEKVPCKKYPLKAEQFPQFCEAFAFDYESRWLFGVERRFIVISVFHDQKTEIPVIQLFEHNWTTKKLKEIQKELSDLMSKEFGNDSVQVMQ